MTNPPAHGWSLVLDHRCFEPTSPSDKTYLGPTGAQRSCKFCGKGKPDVRFKNESHVIPAAFGNRTLFSLEECDNCNTRFSVLEDDLVNSLGLARAMWVKRTRSGPARLKLHGHEPVASQVVSANEHGDPEIVFVVDDPSVVVEHVDDHTTTVSAVLPAFRPMNVAKALARMGLFALDIESDPVLRRMRQWVCGGREWVPVIFSVFFPGPQDREFGLRVWKATDSSAPPYFVEFGSGSFRYVLPFPDASWSPWENRWALPLEADFPFPPKIELLVIQSDKAVRGVRQSVTLHGLRVERAIPDSGADPHEV